MKGKNLRIAAIIGAVVLLAVGIGVAIFTGTQIISAQAQSASQDLLGLTLNPVAQAATQTPGTSNSEPGLVVVIVNANGPAAAAGVKRGDILLKINDKAVNSYADLKNALSGLKSGDTVTLSVMHGDTPETLSLTLGSSANGSPSLGLVPFGGNGKGNGGRKFGFHGGAKVAGAYITSVDANSPASTAGLKQGDVIVSVDGTNVDATNTLASLIGAHKPGDKVTLSVTSSGATNSVTVTLGDQNGKAFLGVQYVMEGVGRGGMGNKVGAFVTSVDANSPAATAGIKQGDIILSVNGTTVDATNTLASLVSAHKAGDQLTLSVSSGGTTRDVTVTLGDQNGSAYLGVQVQMEGFGRGFGPGPFSGRGFNLPSGVTQAIGISSVVSGGPADKAGIKAGDVITKVNGTAVTTADAFVQAIQGLKVGDTVTLTVYAQGATTSSDVQVTLGDNPQSAGKPYLGVSLFGIDTTQQRQKNGSGSGSNFPFRGGSPNQTQPSAPSGTGA